MYTLVTTEWLHDHLHDPDLRIIDIRGHVLPASEPMPHYFNHQADYEISHIPGAVFVDWIKQITSPDDPHHSQIAKPERYAAVISSLGIDENTMVVAYDDAGGMFAARLYWSLNYYGHLKVAVLNGGWQKWIQENRPVTAEVPTIQPSQFIPKPDPALIRTADQVQAKLGSPEITLVDVRTPGEYKGQFARAKRKGHIPGAVNIPRHDLITAPDGMMRPKEEVKALAEKAGVQDNEIICYCNGGVSGSYGFLAMRVAGHENVALYDGSWKDWGNDDSKPIE